MENTKEGKIKVISNAERVNLHDYGYKKSGSVNGDPDIYASYLERIANGDLVEENYKGLSEAEKNERRERLKVIENKYEEMDKSNEKVNKDIDTKEKKIDAHREELLKIREDKSKDKGLLQNESFSPLKFGVNLFLLVMLTFYLFFFYVSAAYKALYVDLEGLANNLAEGLSTGSVMPGPAELGEALQYNYLLFLIPFVFYAFGWAFHIILDLKHKVKIAFVVALISITFVVDFLIALIIHNNSEAAKELMGLAPEKWSQSSTFYIILAFGFLVYILWSILLDSLLREWKKNQVTTNLFHIIKHLKKDIKILSKKLLPVDEIKYDISMLKDDLRTSVQGNLKSYIDQFTTGWISYLAPESFKDTKAQCLHIKQEFEDKYKVKPGIVKVLQQRG